MRLSETNIEAHERAQAAPPKRGRPKRGADFLPSVPVIEKDFLPDLPEPMRDEELDNAPHVAQAATELGDAEATDETEDAEYVAGSVVFTREGLEVLEPGDGLADVRFAYPVAAASLTGDPRDFVLDRIKRNHDKRPWKDRSEADQRALVAETEHLCGGIVRRAILAMQSALAPGIEATLVQISVKNGVKAVLDLPRHHAGLADLIRATGSLVILHVDSAEAFTGQRAPAPIDPDQKDLIRAAEQAHENATSSIDEEL